jgi:hypothetical protein
MLQNHGHNTVPNVILPHHRRPQLRLQSQGLLFSLYCHLPQAVPYNNAYPSILCSVPPPSQHQLALVSALPPSGVTRRQGKGTFATKPTCISAVFLASTTYCDTSPRPATDRSQLNCRAPARPVCHPAVAPPGPQPATSRQPQCSLLRPIPRACSSVVQPDWPRSRQGDPDDTARWHRSLLTWPRCGISAGATATTACCYGVRLKTYSPTNRQHWPTAN